MNYQINVIAVPNMATDRPKTCCEQFKQANINANPTASTNNILYHFCPQCGMRIS